VQPSGDRVRLNAQLIDAGSGAHLWAEQFDTARGSDLPALAQGAPSRVM
jgi:TolB-like protein